MSTEQYDLEKHPLTLGEKLGIASKFGMALLALPFNLVFYLLPSGGAPLYKDRVAHAFSRSIQTLSIRQFMTLAVQGANEANYEAMMKTKDLPKTVTKAPAGPIDTQLLWFGKSTARKVIFYGMGCGYTFPLDAGQAKWLCELQSYLQSQGQDVAIALLDIDFFPKKTYPHQIIQAAIALNHLLETRSPSDITLFGYSSGANMMLALLSHILHPRDDIPRVTLPPNSQLAGLLVMSGVLSFDPTFDSYKTNAGKDILHQNIPLGICGAWLGGAAPDNYNEPASADPAWWKGAPMKRTLTLVGGIEILRDSNARWFEQFKIHNPNSEFIAPPGEVHTSPKDDGTVMNTTVREWLAGC